MRALDWARLLTEHRVPYVSAGANVKRGEINIRCPFCGTADPSHHMGLELETGWWSCWRNRAQHSGKSPIRLIMKLLRVPYGRAREIAGLGDDFVDPEGFDALAARLMGRGEIAANKQEVQRRFLDLDPNFLPILRKIPTRRFWEYLCDSRGFDGASALGEDVDVLCRQYGLRCALTGEFQDRVILPYIMDGELVTWSGRAVSESRYRYKDLDLDACLCPPKETLFNHDAIYRGGKALVLVEGPIDVLKIDFYGKPWGVRAVGMSTNSLSEEQVFLLQAAEDHFDQLLVMADNASVLGIADSMRLKQELSFFRRVGITGVPDGAKDAGALKPRQLIEWARALAGDNS